MATGITILTFSIGSKQSINIDWCLESLDSRYDTADLKAEEWAEPKAINSFKHPELQDSAASLARPDSSPSWNTL